MVAASCLDPMWLTGFRALRRLPQERLAMLLLAGVDMNVTTPAEWLADAHAAAHFVTGGCCAAVPPPPWPTHRDHQRQLDGHSGSSSIPGWPRAAEDRALQLRWGVTHDPLQAQQQALLRPPSPVAVRRWVLTQKVLVEQRRLSSAQFRYLTMLGETYLLHGVPR